MAVIADRVVVELEAKLDKYNANLKRAENTFARSVGSQQREIRALEAQIARSSGGISSSLQGLAGTFAAAFSVQQVAGLADTYTRFTNQLKVAGLEGDRLASVQSRLFAIAQEGGVPMELLGRLYGGLSTLQKDLNTTSADSLALSEAVSNSIRIQGTSAEQAAGGILGLNQALGSARVQTDEFNQIVDGVRPLLQAAVNGSDKYAGSINRLKVAIGEGEVSGRDLFELLQGGYAELATKADEATLTIANSFTVLNNALGMYIGQTDDSLSATERVSAAIISLSENLDTITNALGVLGAVMLGRYVAGMVAATTATGVAGTAMFALQARAIGAATTMEALALVSATTGRAMLAAFGGPVGIAIAALSVGIYYLATRTDEARQASATYQQQLAVLADVKNKTTDATDRLATATGRAREEALANARALQQETAQYLANARAALEAARAKAREQALAGQQRVLQSTRTVMGAGGGYDPTIGAIRRKNATDEQNQADVNAANQTVRGLEAELKRITNAINAPAPVVNVTPTTTKPTKRTGPDPAKEAERLAEEAARKERQRLQTEADVDNQIAQYGVERLRSIAEMTGSANDRAIAEAAAGLADRQAFERALLLDEDLTDAQRDRLRAARSAADAQQRTAIAARRQAQLADEALARESDNRQGQGEIIRARGEVNDRDRSDRTQTELHLMDLQFDEERAQQEAILASETSTQLEKDIAAAKLERLGTLRDLAEQAIRLKNQSPFEAYMRELDKTEGQINDDLETIAVDGLESLNDGITDAITGAKSIGEAFSDVANSIIADLIRIAVQQAIIKPLADLLNPGGGGIGGGIGGGVGSFFAGLFGGRASGGHVTGGNMYRVTDGEGFVPAGSGKIVPLGRMRGAAQGGGDGGVHISVPVSVSAPGANQETVSLIRRTIAEAAPTIVQAAQRATARSMTRKRIT